MFKVQGIKGFGYFRVKVLEDKGAQGLRCSRVRVFKVLGN